MDNVTMDKFAAVLNTRTSEELQKVFMEISKDDNNLNGLFNKHIGTSTYLVELFGLSVKVIS